MKDCHAVDPPAECRPFRGSFLDFEPMANHPQLADAEILDDAYEALAVLQHDYFDTDYGTWSSAIDWTGAVIETIVSGMLSTLSTSLGSDNVSSNAMSDWKAKENLISSYFSQVVGSFFGQDILSIRGEAYDDILWVVLGWLEAIRFVKRHGDLHYPNKEKEGGASTSGLGQALQSMAWHGQNWVGGFAHRSRVFWSLGISGWDTRLCHGGMIWNRRLQPYKNAITNELWISASISMYNHFPGDNFSSPWINEVAFPKKDPLHLAAAVEGYKWLMNVNMMNKQGLFVDGYHIDSSKAGNTECDLRDEMVYTYNQGVLLTGQRGLWEATGMASYLEDGHALVQSVIAATGWSLVDNAPLDSSPPPPGRLPVWRGIGRGGILEEQCDASGTCSQDAQTFKSIFFHHLTAFCAPLEPLPLEMQEKHDSLVLERVRSSHASACQSYIGWVRYNALAALGTRNQNGQFGMWWGASVFKVTVSKEEDGIDHHAENCTDYRNDGTPLDMTWGSADRWMPGTGSWKMTSEALLVQPEVGQQVMTKPRKDQYAAREPSQDKRVSAADPNDRGRGRTVETQVGGLAILRTFWELSQAYR
ncbi:glycosyl hydrolase family 76-domain-containing protein [Stachybotrys elegans]|uniref:Glycosyl hydrolase family 76-domain-containing protein n=1 Tax=Stachybotrys elegans TaxID=80388 RepID=A0A8K0WPM0_9HYPO|nr:glycosyl hydrolase family 76-domain-containing protein [Stachybotrys elegans]